MTIAATVNAEAADIVGDAMKPPRQKHKWQKHLRCIYCEIVVGEPVLFREGLFEEESYTKTDDGPVCDECMADPLAAARVESGNVQDERRVTFRAQVRSSLTGEERVERDAQIVRMHDAGASYAVIAPLVGMTHQGTASAARRFRERRGAQS